MKRYAVILAVVLAVVGIGAGVNIAFRGSSISTSLTAVGTYANSNVDTLTWRRAGTESAVSFFIKTGDSVSITNVILRRQHQGTLLAVIAGDTILGATSSTSNTGYAAYGSINLAPYCDSALIFVTYAGSNNGVTSPYVQYGIGKKF